MNNRHKFGAPGAVNTVPLIGGGQSRPQVAHVPHFVAAPPKSPLVGMWVYEGCEHDDDKDTPRVAGLITDVLTTRAQIILLVAFEDGRIRDLDPEDVLLCNPPTRPAPEPAPKEDTNAVEK